MARRVGGDKVESLIKALLPQSASPEEEPTLIQDSLDFNKPLSHCQAVTAPPTKKPIIVPSGFRARYWHKTHL